MTIRNATPADAAALAAVEAACCPAAEAASEAQIAARLAVFPEKFFLAEENGRVIGFIDGAVIDRPTLTDAMYEDPALHRPLGAWQAVYGLNTLPDCRRRGVAAALMNALLDAARAEGRRGAALTCKQALIPYYEKFGYRLLGPSASQHGGAAWYDMLLEF